MLGLNDGVIKDLVLINSKVEGYNLITGGICGYNRGNIYNCINKASVISNKETGGIAARGAGSFTQCGNYGDICSTENSARRNIWKRIY